jgi:hypothetical protein
MLVGGGRGQFQAPVAGRTDSEVFKFLKMVVLCRPVCIYSCWGGSCHVDEGNKFLRNIVHLPDYTASHPRRQNVS